MGHYQFKHIHVYVDVVNIEFVKIGFDYHYVDINLNDFSLILTLGWPSVHESCIRIICMFTYMYSEMTLKLRPFLLFFMFALDTVCLCLCCLGSTPPFPVSPKSPYVNSSPGTMGSQPIVTHPITPVNTLTRQQQGKFHHHCHVIEQWLILLHSLWLCSCSLYMYVN